MIDWRYLPASKPGEDDLPVVMRGDPKEQQPTIARSLEACKRAEKARAWVPMAELTFDEDLAWRLVDYTSEGGTLAAWCLDIGLPRAIIYGWLRDPDNMLGEESFEQVYAQAKRDRAQSWLDDSLATTEDLNLTGRRDDTAKLRKAEQLARLKIKLAQDTLNAKGSGPSGEGAPRVFITTFQEVLEEGEEDAD